MTGPLNCFPMRSEWDATRPASQSDPFPAPEVTSREPWPADVTLPRSVLALAEYARELHWDVITQYARGYVPHATTGRPSATVREDITLRFGRHPMTQRQGYASYTRPVGGTWSWSSFMIWGPGLPVYSDLSLAEMKDFLARAADRDLEMQAWVVGIKALREVKVKSVARKASLKKREGMS